MPLGVRGSARLAATHTVSAASRQFTVQTPDGARGRLAAAEAAAADISPRAARVECREEALESRRPCKRQCRLTVECLAFT